MPILSNGIPNGNMWLNKNPDTTMHLYASMTMSKEKSWLLRASQCDHLLDLFGSYKDSTIIYNAIAPYGGPNSNSFVHSLLSAGQIPIPFWVNVDLTVAAPGWLWTTLPFGK